MAVAGIAAMFYDVVFAVGLYSVFQFEVTPATVIAFLTILGYSLYDTIVVFDRVNENEGRYAAVRMPYEDIVNISMNQVIMRSLLTSLSSILPVISLLLIGRGCSASSLSRSSRWHCSSAWSRGCCRPSSSPHRCSPGSSAIPVERAIGSDCSATTCALRSSAPA